MKMNSLYALILGSWLCLGCAKTPEGEKFGKDLTLKETVKISVLMENMPQYLGKPVLVEGKIVDVCSKRGCWMELASDMEFQKIKIKVEDGEIIFPVTAKGKTARVEGVVESIELSKENALKYYEHQAEEKGSTFDPASVTGPVTIYQIRGTGAVIR
ncbi:DUF4920 domain-containing protein [bacterium]|nr:DUF4920 domain-containing protein [bacterium]